MYDILEEQQEELLADIATTEVALENLLALNADIHAIGGVSQNDVQLMQTYSEGMVALESIQSTLPDLRTFTQSPSLTNFNVATESLLVKIKAVFKWMFEQIVKFFKWVKHKVVMLYKWVTTQSKNVLKKVTKYVSKDILNASFDIDVFGTYVEKPSSVTAERLISKLTAANKHFKVKDGALEYTETGYSALDKIVVSCLDVFNISHYEMSEEKTLGQLRDNLKLLAKLQLAAVQLDVDREKYPDASAVRDNIVTMLDEYISEYLQTVNMVEAHFNTTVSGVQPTTTNDSATTETITPDSAKAFTNGTIKNQQVLSTAAVNNRIWSKQLRGVIINSPCPVSVFEQSVEMMSIVEVKLNALQESLRAYADIQPHALDDILDKLKAVEPLSFETSFVTVLGRIEKLGNAKSVVDYYTRNEFLVKHFTTLTQRAESLQDKLSSLDVGYKHAKRSIDALLELYETNGGTTEVLVTVQKRLADNLKLTQQLYDVVLMDVAAFGGGLQAVAFVLDYVDATYSKK